MASAQQRAENRIHDFEISGNARTHIGDHFGHVNHYLPQERPETPPEPFSNVPFPRDPDFVDRVSITEGIEEKLARPAARVALVGLGGVGKSQLAIEYAHRVRERSPDTFVIWLHASSAERFEASVRETLEQLKVPGRKDREVNIYQLLRAWLRETKGVRKWLIMIDNADDSRFLVQPPHISAKAQDQHATQARVEERCIDYFPACEHGALLLTSRNQDAVRWMLRQDDIVRVNAMDMEHACALVTKRLGSATQPNDAELCELSERLDYMPLALAQAASYIRRKAPRCSVREYCAKLRRSGKSQLRLLTHGEGDCRRDRDAENSILLTWEISFNQIRQERPSAADSLSLMSFFDRQTIPESLLRKRGAGSTGSTTSESESRLNSNQDTTSDHGSVSDCESEHFDDDIQVLRDYSLIAVTADPSVFEMHSLVQLATQRWLELNKRYEHWGRCFVNHLDDAIPETICSSDTKALAIAEAVYPHAVMALGHRLVAREAIERRFNLASKITLYAIEMKTAAYTEPFAHHNFDVCKMLYGERHISTLACMSFLGVLYYSQFRYALAEGLFLKGMELTEDSSWEIHARFVGHLAMTYAHMNRLEETERLMHTCVELLEKHGREDSSALLHLIDSITAAYAALGDNEMEEALLSAKLDAAEKAGPKGRKALMHTMRGLAANYAELGRYEESENMMLHLLEISKSELGIAHRHTLQDMSSLTSIRWISGQQDSAIKLQNECVELAAQALGREHPFSLEAANLLDHLQAVHEGSDDTATLLGNWLSTVEFKDADKWRNLVHKIGTTWAKPYQH